VDEKMFGGEKMNLTELKQNVASGAYRSRVGQRYLEVDIDDMVSVIDAGIVKAGETYGALVNLQDSLKEKFEFIEESLEGCLYGEEVAKAFKTIAEQLDTLMVNIDKVGDIYDDIEELS
jgi:hypothetical protein